MVLMAITVTVVVIMAVIVVVTAVVIVAAVVIADRGDRPHSPRPPMIMWITSLI